MLFIQIKNQLRLLIDISAFKAARQAGLMLFKKAPKQKANQQTKPINFVTDDEQASRHSRGVILASLTIQF
ncbi:hypothetical protein [Chitinimonas sp. BJB300]|uniref:hypothetical protein n=1 Tax=Chitinimonas sp. BJB300 TaxID=1559339 RepID=UPI0011126564|nr:hypothetical protein [Chitinimonas sp. BJB300]TSJ88623.1 hypothetical protein FG002_010725 [Chitinimonas sp. BJB300]